MTLIGLVTIVCGSECCGGDVGGVSFWKDVVVLELSVKVLLFSDDSDDGVSDDWESVYVMNRPFSFRSLIIGLLASLNG
jgi:hypothetical protein